MHTDLNLSFIFDVFFVGKNIFDRVAKVNQKIRIIFLTLNTAIRIVYFISSGSPIVQSVPLATEPGISLIILTPMKMLQRNLNRSMFFSFTFLTQ